MPTVQYQPTDWQVRPSEAQFRAPDVSTGGGYLAEGLGHVANVADQITQISAETQARAQALQDGQAVSAVLADFKNLTGQNAVNAQKETMAKIAAIQSAAQSAMGTPMMQRMYQAHAGAVYASANAEIYGHTAQQVHVAYGQQLGAETSAAQNTASGLYDQPEAFGKALSVVKAKAMAEAAFAGHSADVQAEYAKGKYGEAVAGAIRTALAGEKVDQAQAIYKNFGGEALPFAIRNQVMAELAAPLFKRQVGAIVEAAQAGSQQPPAQDENGNWIVPKVATPAPGSGAPSATYQMPVAGGRVTSTFSDHQERGSAGVDLAAPLNTPIKSIAVGTVVGVGNDDRSGNYVMVRHPDGTTSSYSHLGNVSVKDGDDVNANTVLGTVGLTGHTTGAHVHLRVRDADGKDVDPMKVLGGKAGTYASATAPGSTAFPDETKVLANIDAMGLPPEIRDAAKSMATEKYRQAHAAQNQAYSDAADKVQEWVSNYALAHGNQYPDPAAIPAPMINAMRPGDAAAYKLQIAKARENEAKADGRDSQSQRYADLQIMRYTDPDGFAKLDMGREMSNLSAGQWNQMRVMQAEVKAKMSEPAKPWDAYKGSFQALTTFQRFNPEAFPALAPKATDDERKAHALAVANALEGIRTGAMEISQANGGRAPTAAEWHALAQNATTRVTTTQPGWFGSTTTQTPIYNIKSSDIPQADRDLITKAWKQAHPGAAQPGEADLVAGYQRLHAHRALRGQ